MPNTKLHVDQSGNALLRYALFILFFLICGSAKTYSQPLPKSVWLSLGYSSIATQLPDIGWVRSWAGTHDLSGAGEGANKIDAIIVPVFINGKCLYETDLSPFADFADKEAQKEQEKALRALCHWARGHGIKVFLGFNVLDWRAIAGPNRSASVSLRPTWQDVPRADSRLTSVETVFASPFDGDVRDALGKLVSEAVKKFPESSGVAFDLHLSRREILGYSLPARTAAVKELSLDPLGIPLDGSADATLDSMAESWMKWRQQKMRSLLNLLMQASRQAKPNTKVLVSGDVGYYEYEQLNRARSVQDWVGWTEDDPDATPLVEGRWLDNYHDATSVKEIAAVHTRLRGRYLPMLMGSGLGLPSDYLSEWYSYAAEPQLNTSSAVLLVNNEEDMRRALAFAALRSVQRPPSIIEVGQIAPKIELPDVNGRSRSTLEFVGKRGVVICFALASNNGGIKDVPQGLQKIVVTSDLVRKQQDPATLILTDQGHVTADRFPNISEIVVDKSGFITAIGRIPPTSVLEVKEAIPATIKVGQQSPDFRIKDMRGREMKLSSLRGKMVLLTFFPRSFTTGCSSQLSALEASQASLKSLGVQIVGVSVDPFDLQNEFAKHLKLSFDLIPDVGRNVCLLYGAVTDKHGLATRMSILLDKQGKVIWIDKNISVETYGDDVERKIRQIVKDAKSG